MVYLDIFNALTHETILMLLMNVCIHVHCILFACGPNVRNLGYRTPIASHLVWISPVSMALGP